MTKTTVKRRDIELREEVDYYYASGPVYRSWVACLSGRLSSQEEVVMSRTGDTPQEALSVLESAIRDQGWGIE